ncbi:MAG: hypothetical protein GXO24_05500 [Chlorobi bacterium]|nr:hypothetical protein [Chlorobiota bacterium]
MESNKLRFYADLAVKGIAAALIAWFLVNFIAFLGAWMQVRPEGSWKVAYKSFQFYVNDRPVGFDFHSARKLMLIVFLATFLYEYDRERRKAKKSNPV